MQIMDEYQTIHYLLANRASIARYGDGELKLCLGKSAKSQISDEMMQHRLKKILKSSDNAKCVVGIPRIYSDGDFVRMSERKGGFWKKYSGGRFSSLYNQNKMYGSAFITRPDAAPDIDKVEYYDLVKSIWRDRDVLVMHGEGTGFLKRISILETAKTYEVMQGPIRDAFSEHYNLMTMLLNSSDPETVILLSLGPEATILAYDLAEKNRQALDLGHMGMFYAHVHPKDKNWDGIKREIC